MPFIKVTLEQSLFRSRLKLFYKQNGFSSRIDPKHKSKERWLYLKSMEPETDQIENVFSRTSHTTIVWNLLLKIYYSSSYYWVEPNVQ